MTANPNYVPDFTVADILHQVRLLANESPDFVYEPPGEDSEVAGCSYLTGSQGKGCIVGQALSRLGVPLEVLRESEGQNAIGVLERLNMAPERHARNMGDWNAEERLLQGIQSKQDCQTPWGEAVAQAEAEVLVSA